MRSLPLSGIPTRVSRQAVRDSRGGRQPHAQRHCQRSDVADVPAVTHGDIRSLIRAAQTGGRQSVDTSQPSRVAILGQLEPVDRHAYRNGHRPDTDSGHRLRPNRGRGQLAGPHRPTGTPSCSAPKAADRRRGRHHGLRPRPRCLVEGAGLGPGAVVGRFLRANRDARTAYAADAAIRGVSAPHRVDRRQARRRRRATASWWPPRAWHAQLHRQRRLAGTGGRGIRARHARRRDLSRRAARRPVRRSVDGPLGALRPQDHRAHLGFRTTRVAADPRHAVLGSRLLPHLFRAAGRSSRLHVGGGGSHSRAGESERLLQRPRGLPAPAQADVGDGARHRDRLTAGVRRRRRHATSPRAGRGTRTPSPRRCRRGCAKQSEPRRR